MQNLKHKLGTFWWGVLFLTIFGAITYLPLVSKMGYMNDDWYLMFDGYVGGASFFHNVFSIDRPLRGYVMQVAFSLFGMNPLYYHLSAFIFRVISAVSLFWIGNQLWINRKTYNWVAALLFLIYPGFLSQVNPIDYQSQIFSLACGMVSIVCTLKAFDSKTLFSRWMYIVASILLTWIYMGLVEYFIGFEVLRFAIIMILFLRKENQNLFTKLKAGFQSFLPFLIGAGGFLIWRLFFFEAERKATDISLQLSSAFNSPLTILWWFNYLIQDTLEVVLTAWTVPLNIFSFSLRLRDAFIGIALAILAVSILLMFLRLSKENVEVVETESMSREMREQFWLAIATIVACLIPVILVNRQVTIPDYSRYALASSVGVGILFSAIIEKVNVVSLRAGILGFLLGISVLTHHGNAVRVVKETEATRNFWWQVAWRAPQIQEGVTLIASYSSALSEDYFIWGPANFIYYPEKQDVNPILIKLPAAVLTPDVINQITTNGGLETPLRRGNYLERDFGNVLVMVQSSENGCVRIINGDSPELSPYDEDRLVLIAPYSRLENIITEGDSPIVPVEVFGEEPKRGWCYYYQKADLARQRGDWEQIPNLLQEALDQEYYPDDAVEWMPFLQAYAVIGDVEKMQSTLKLLALNRFLSLQTCEIMLNFMQEQILSSEVQDLIQKKICE